MSDAPQGPGWWRATDGRWYPPEAAAAPTTSPAQPAPFPASPSGPPTSPEATGRRWKTWQLVVTAAVAALVGIGIGVAVGGGNDDPVAAGDDATPTTGSASETTEEPESTETTETTETTEPTSSGGDGSQEQPHPLGTAAPVGDYEVTVLSFVADATADVMAANQFNETPPAGSVYSLVRLRATYTGETEGTPAFDLTAGYIGADGRVYSDPDCSAVEPDSMIDQPSVVAGGTVEGNFCLLMPAANLGTGALFVESTVSFEEDRVWWAES